MQLFCPNCANALTVSRTASSDEYPEGLNRMECRTCPYQFLLRQRYYERREMKRREVEDVLGGPKQWANVDHTDVQCPKEGCDGTKAFFQQIQTRSADEPMTLFYKASAQRNCSAHHLAILV